MPVRDDKAKTQSLPSQYVVATGLGQLTCNMGILCYLNASKSFTLPFVVEASDALDHHTAT